MLSLGTASQYAGFCDWCRKYASLTPSQTQQQELEAENNILNRLIATSRVTAQC
jgi:hypothetical protein